MEKLYSDISGLLKYLKEKIKLYDKKLNKETYIKFNVERLETTPNSDYSSFKNSKLIFLEEEIWDNNDINPHFSSLFNFSAYTIICFI